MILNHANYFSFKLYIHIYFLSINIFVSFTSCFFFVHLLHIRLKPIKNKGFKSDLYGPYVGPSASFMG